MYTLDLIKISKTFDSKAIPALKNLSFSLSRGEIAALFGPSGTGKTTLFKIIAGQGPSDSGEVVRNGKAELVRDIAEFGAEKTVDEIIGEKISHLGPEEKIQRKREVIEMFSLFYKNKKQFRQLSLGEKKRVALAQSIAPRPAILLMDEPFSSLDFVVKEEIKSELRDIIKKEEMTCFYISHNFQDIVSFSEKIIVLNMGEIRQIGTPLSILHFPRDAHVAKLIGKCNLIPCEVAIFEKQNILVQSVLGKMSFRHIHPLITGENKRLNILVWPHEFEIGTRKLEGEMSFKGLVQEVTEEGFSKILRVVHKEKSYIIESQSRRDFQKGQEIYFAIKLEEARLILI